jgi:hypothetical protein
MKLRPPPRAKQTCSTFLIPYHDRDPPNAPGSGSIARPTRHGTVALVVCSNRLSKKSNPNGYMNSYILGISHQFHTTPTEDTRNPRTNESTPLPTYHLPTTSKKPAPSQPRQRWRRRAPRAQGQPPQARGRGRAKGRARGWQRAHRQPRGRRPQPPGRCASGGGSPLRGHDGSRGQSPSGRRGKGAKEGAAHVAVCRRAAAAPGHRGGGKYHGGRCGRRS